MGRFTCVCCKNSYFDRRFLWEVEEARDGDTVYTYTEILGDADSDGEVHTYTEILGDAISDGEVAFAADDRSKSSSGDPTTVSLRMCVPPSSCCRSNGKTGQDDFRVIADATRASGTTANLIGSVAPWLHAPLSPVSAVGGAIGAVSGAMQLHQGLSSEVIDPHLVTKGGVTTGVGSICMALGLASAAFPVLFPVSLAIGAVGLGLATGVDASMDGLCPACRDAAPPVEAAAADH